MARIEIAGEHDLPELLTLMRGYCDFYEVAPSDEDLLRMSRALIADPAREGMQLFARDESGRAIGFATIFWTWSTTRAARIGVMNDLFVAQGARGARRGRRAHRGLPGALPGPRRRPARVEDGARQRSRPGGVRPRRRPALAMA